MSDSWVKWCRLCAKLNSDSIQIFQEKEKQLHENIERYLGFRVDEKDISLPQILCHLCHDKLSDFISFANNCTKVQQLFQKLLDIKPEEDSNVILIKQQFLNGDLENFKNDLYIDETDSAESLNIEADPFYPSDDSEPIRKRTRTKRKTKSKKNNKKTSTSSGPKKIKSDLKSKPPPKKRGRPSLKDKKQKEQQDLNKENEQEEENEKEIEDTEDQETSKNKTAPSVIFKWECHVCERVCTNWHSLSVHCRKNHDTTARVICQCSKVLASRASIIKHRLKHTNAYKFRCPECNKPFHRRSLYDAHILSHVPKDQQPFVCCKCARRFHCEALLRQHERVHLPREERQKFPCNICSKQFSSRSAVSAHVKAIHFGERPFVCDQCGQSFTSKGILQEHLTIHSDETPFVCQTCNKKFKTKYRLKIHSDIHRGTPYVCPICQLQLSTRRTLRMHLVVHRDTKAFQCATCGKAFRRAKDLKNHHNLHTGQRPYTCTFCPRTFANGSNCRSHKRRMHPEELRLYEASLQDGNIPTSTNSTSNTTSYEGALQVGNISTSTITTSNITSTSPTISTSKSSMIMPRNSTSTTNSKPSITVTLVSQPPLPTQTVQHQHIPIQQTATLFQPSSLPVQATALPPQSTPATLHQHTSLVTLHRQNPLNLMHLSGVYRTPMNSQPQQAQHQNQGQLQPQPNSTTHQTPAPPPLYRAPHITHGTGGNTNTPTGPYQPIYQPGPAFPGGNPYALAMGYTRNM